MTALEEVNKRIDMALANYRAAWCSGNEREEQFWGEQLGDLYNEREEIKRGEIK